MTKNKIYICSKTVVLAARVTIKENETVIVTDEITELLTKASMYKVLFQDKSFYVYKGFFNKFFYLLKEVAK